MSGTVIIVAVIAVFCLLVGPILMLQPTPRQRQLAQLRARAGTLGLSVSTSVLEGKPYTVYGAPWPQQSRYRFGAAPWTLVRKPYEHPIHLAGVWDHSDQNHIDPTAVTAVTALLERLPGAVVALSASPRGLAAYWLEKGPADELDKLAAMLKNAVEELWPLVREPDPSASPAADVHRGEP